MSDSIDVIMLNDLVHYPDRVNRAFYPKGSKQTFTKEKADKFLGAGYCELLERPKCLNEKETKPAPFLKETKPAAKKVATKKKASTKKKTTSKRVSVEKQSNDSTDD